MKNKQKPKQTASPELNWDGSAFLMTPPSWRRKYSILYSEFYEHEKKQLENWGSLQGGKDDKAGGGALKESNMVEGEKLNIKTPLSYVIQNKIWQTEQVWIHQSSAHEIL